MSTFDIVAVVILVVVLLPIVYSLVRLPFRLRSADVEPAGRWLRRYRDEKPED